MLDYYETIYNLVVQALNVLKLNQQVAVFVNYLSRPHPIAVAGKPFSLITNLCDTRDMGDHPTQLFIIEVITCTAPVNVTIMSYTRR